MPFPLNIARAGTDYWQKLVLNVPTILFPVGGRGIAVQMDYLRNTDYISNVPHEGLRLGFPKSSG